VKFKCPGCKNIITIDMRKRANRRNLTEKGYYRTICDKVDKIVNMKKVAK
jgi:hypothetical protein